MSSSSLVMSLYTTDCQPVNFPALLGGSGWYYANLNSDGFFLKELDLSFISVSK